MAAVVLLAVLSAVWGALAALWVAAWLRRQPSEEEKAVREFRAEVRAHLDDVLEAWK